MINYMFWAEQVGVDPPQGERPKCYSRLDMIPDDVSSRMLERRVASCGENPKNPWPTKEKKVMI